MTETVNFWDTLTPEEQEMIDESQWGNDQLMFSSESDGNIDKEI